MVTVRAAGGKAWANRLLLRPNAPMALRYQGLFMVMLIGVMGALCAVFVAHGLWLVLPYCGLDAVGMGAALWVTTVKARRLEVIEIKGDRLRVRRCGWKAVAPVEFPAAWARVRVRAGAVKNHPSRLEIGAHGQWVAVGAFLTERERRRAADKLCETLAPHSAWSDPGRE